MAAGRWLGALFVLGTLQPGCASKTSSGATPNVVCPPSESSACESSADTAGAPSTELALDILIGDTSPLAGKSSIENLPVLEVEVAGERTLAIVDTGASSSVVARWLADEGGLQLEPLDMDGGAGGGKTVRVLLHRGAAVSLPGWGPVAAAGIVAIDLPEFFRDLGVGVILSPFDIPREGEMVVLDFGRRRLWRDSFFDATRTLAREGRPLEVEGLSNCAPAGWKLPITQIYAPAEIDGVPAILLVDTGADSTRLRGATRAADALLEAKGRGASEGQVLGAGGSYPVTEVEGVALALGDRSWTTTVTVGPPVEDEEPCASDGTLGMDVMQDCRLGLTTRSLSFYCDR